MRSSERLQEAVLPAESSGRGPGILESSIRAPGGESGTAATAAVGGSVVADGDARPKRVLLVAGEASGDLHGADLVAALKQRIPNLEVVGVGGSHLREVGMRTIADARDIATVGLLEGVGRLGAILRAYRALAGMLRGGQPDLAVFIDFPEFNLRLARVAKRAGVPVFYYIGPQVWAWRRGRIRTVARRVDALALVFPFEPALYASRCRAVEFVGHPLLDRVRITRGREESLGRYGLDPGRPTVALLPGSRRKEIRYVLPRLLDAAEILCRERGCQFMLALAPTVEPAQVEEEIARRRVEIRVVANDTYNVIHAADVVLVASGTATLETALLERPMVIVYRLSPVTYGVARLLVGVRHIGIPNIVAGRPVVPELVQGLATGQRIAAAAKDILDDPAGRRRMVNELAAIRGRLGPGGAATRAAEIACRLLA